MSTTAATIADRSTVRACLDADVRVLLLGAVDEVDDGALREELAWVAGLARRIATLQAQLASAVGRRAARTAREERPDDPRAGQRAKRRAAKEMADQLHVSPGEAGRLIANGDALRRAPDAAAAARDGRISPRHLRLLDDTLRFVEEEQTRSELRTELLASAEELSPWAFGRLCRRRLAQVDHGAAMRGEDRRWRRRSAKLTTTEDGMTALSAQVSGLDAELLQTAVHAFRRPDAPGEHRSAAQATADAVVQMAAAALRSAEAPAEHGVRPHVLVTIDHDAVLRGAGAVGANWTGDLPFGEVRRMLADAGVSRLLTDPDGLPLEAGVGKRSLPVGLYKSLLVRDGGCIRDGCDAPPGWCDGAHLDEPYGPDGLGRISLQNGALLCRVHHREFDRGALVVEWRAGRPVAVPARGRSDRAYASGASVEPGGGESLGGDGPGVAREWRGEYATGPPDLPAARTVVGLAGRGPPGRRIPEPRRHGTYAAGVSDAGLRRRGAGCRRAITRGHLEPCRTEWRLTR